VFGCAVATVKLWVIDNLVSEAREEYDALIVYLVVRATEISIIAVLVTNHHVCAKPIRRCTDFDGLIPNTYALIAINIMKLTYYPVLEFRQ
jgi:hypothetical protein